MVSLVVVSSTRRLQKWRLTLAGTIRLELRGAAGMLLGACPVKVPMQGLDFHMLFEIHEFVCFSLLKASYSCLFGAPPP